MTDDFVTFDFVTAIVTAPKSAGQLRCSRCGDTVKPGSPMVYLLDTRMDPVTREPPVRATLCVICVGLKAQTYSEIASELSQPDWQDRLARRSKPVDPPTGGG